ncbi:MAG: hypothetical protein EOO74_08555, partial [Myxococcales bacterium]
CAWVDRTEVTFAQYRAFEKAIGLDIVTGGLGDGADLQHTPQCQETNDDFRPDLFCLSQSSATFDPPSQGDLTPVVCVDSCDAEAFCRWAGKTLCGSVDQEEARQNPLYMACSSEGAHAYPYGDTYQGGACNDAGFPTTLDPCPGKRCARDVDTLPACRTPGNHVADLVGNVAEWTSDCDLFNHCDARGGSFLDPEAGASCADLIGYERLTHQPHLGFRCCAR